MVMTRTATVKEFRSNKWDLDPLQEKKMTPSRATLQEVIAFEVRSQVANTLAAIPDMVEEVVGQLFCAVTLSAQVEICAIVYDTLEHVVLVQIKTGVLG